MNFFLYRLTFLYGEFKGDDTPKAKTELQKNGLKRCKEW